MITTRKFLCFFGAASDEDEDDDDSFEDEDEDDDDGFEDEDEDDDDGFGDEDEDDDDGFATTEASPTALSLVAVFSSPLLPSSLPLSSVSPSSRTPA